MTESYAMDTSPSANDTDEYSGNVGHYDVVTKFICKYCARPFSNEDDMNQHTTIHKNTKNEKQECYVCGKTYSTPSKLQRHVRVHSGEKPYLCNICGRRFTRSDHVRQHLKTHLIAKEKNYCRICQHEYQRSQHLHTHLFTSHAIKNIGTCEKCGEGFDDEEKLKLHKVTHENSTFLADQNLGTSAAYNDSLGPVDQKKNYLIGIAKFALGSKKEEGDSETKQQEEEIMKNWTKIEGEGEVGDKGDKKTKISIKRKRSLNNSVEENGSIDLESGSTMVDNNENMFMLNALQNIKEDPDAFHFETLNGEDLQALGDKDLLEEIDEDVDPEKGAVPVHLEAGTHQIDDGRKVTEIVVFPKSGAKVTTYTEPVTSMTAYEKKILKNPNAPNPQKIDPKKLMGPASHKAKMRKKIEMGLPYPAPKAQGLRKLAFSVGLDPNKVAVDMTDKMSEEINARNIAQKKGENEKNPVKKMHKCPHCCIYFEDYAMSLLHNSLHTVDEADPFTCRKCLKKLGNRLEFTAHLIWHLEPSMDG